jgi:hypothetical protein
MLNSLCNKMFEFGIFRCLTNFDEEFPWVRKWAAYRQLKACLLS